MRAGKLADVGTISIKQAEIPDKEIIAAFLAQHYGASLARAEGDDDANLPIALVPDEVILPCEPEGIEGIAEWLADRAGHRVSLAVPKRGHRVDLLEMANENAKHSFAEKQRQADDVHERLRDLQQRLRLPVLPRRIECCDISHLGGGDTVGAVVAMKDGELDKKRYRSFNVRGIGREGNGINDDYGSMYEVLARRFRRAAPSAEGAASLAEATPEPDAEWDAPDLFVVDGGRGQLAVALAAAHDLGLHDLAVIALAKERETVGGEQLVDRVYLPGQKNPIPLKSGTTSLFLLARLRDEAHRFSNRARLRLGKKRSFRSPLDEVRGIGHKAKQALMTHIGNLSAIRAAADAVLLAVPGVTARHVRALRLAFPPRAKRPPAPRRRQRTRPIADQVDVLVPSLSWIGLTLRGVATGMARAPRRARDDKTMRGRRSADRATRHRALSFWQRARGYVVDPAAPSRSVPSLGCGQCGIDCQWMGQATVRHPVRHFEEQRFMNATIKHGLLLASVVAGLGVFGAGCLTRPIASSEPETKTNFSNVVTNQAIDKVDLLFDIDNSASMGDKQTYLSTRSPTSSTASSSQTAWTRRRARTLRIQRGGRARRTRRSSSRPCMTCTSAS